MLVQQREADFPRGVGHLGYFLVLAFLVAFAATANAQSQAA